MAQYGYVNSEFGGTGRIIRVTNTNASGPGSLRAALEANGPRRVVFECAGVFRLYDVNARPSPNVVYLGQDRGDLSVFGQSAPGPVVVVGGLRFSTHDVLLQHITIVGLEDANAAECIDVLGNSEPGSKRIVLDHCTLIRGYSKALQTWCGEPGQFTGREGGIVGLTLIDCVFAEPLRGPKGNRYLAILQEKTAHAAFIRCLFASAQMRHPAIHDAVSALVQNCFIFDAAEASIHLMVSPTPTGPTRATIVGNYIEPGPATGADGDRVLVNAIAGSEVYLKDNIARREPRLVTPSVISKAPPLPTIEPLLAARDVPAYVLSNVGPTPWNRAPHDVRVVERVRARLSRREDTNAAWDGLPVYLPTVRPLGEITDLPALLRQFEPQRQFDLSKAREQLAAVTAALTEVDDTALNMVQTLRLQVAQIRTLVDVAAEELG